MKTKSLDPIIVRVSVRFYQWLLAAYPSSFRKEFGPHMLQVFRDYCVQTVRDEGQVGMMSLWYFTLFDLAQSSITEHLQKEIYMTKSKLVRLSGWFLILGAITFFMGTIRWNVMNTTLIFPHIAFDQSAPFLFHLQIFGHYVGPILIAIGLIGLYAQYGRLTGSTRYILRFGVSICMAVYILIDIMVISAPTLERYVYHYYKLIGAFVMFACLAIFGIQMFRKKPMPGGNAVALIAGVSWMAVAPNLLWLLSLHSFTKNHIPSFLLITGHLIAAIALVLLGYGLQKNDEAVEREVAYA
jgi:hypothetical protein